MSFLPSLLLVLPWAQAGLEPELVLDANPTLAPSSEPYDSGVNFLGEFGSGFLVGGQSYTTGPSRGVWLVDPVTLEAELLTGGAGDQPDSVTFLGGEAHFRLGFHDLWSTDGTAAGTQRYYSGQDAGVFLDTDPVAFDGYVWFMVDPNVSEQELWRSDGTELGTELVHVFRTEASQGSVHAALGRLFVGLGNFTCTTGGSFNALFALDDAASTPLLLANTQVRDFESNGGALEFQGELWFAGCENNTGVELWRTDGTPAGTTLVVDANPGTGDGETSLIVADAGRLWFSAATNATGSELWTSDGTSAGTELLLNLGPGAIDGVSGRQGALLGDGRLVFPVFDGSVYELYVSDGSLPSNGGVGTYPLKGVAGTSLELRDFVGFGGSVYFSMSQPALGYELWSTDGTVLGSGNVIDLYPGTEDSSPEPFVAASELWMRATDPIYGEELWRTDGTALGTELAVELAPGPTSISASPAEFLPLLDTLLYAATDGAVGSELWITNGEAGGTQLVFDIGQGFNAGSPEPLVALEDRVLISAFAAGAGRELWVSDGTAAGTQPVADFWPGTISSFPSRPARLGDVALIVAFDGVVGPQLFRTDGTAAGTVQLTFGPHFFTNVDQLGPEIAGEILFAAEGPGDEGVELWKTDGTAAGTGLLLDIYPGPEGSSPIELVGLDEWVLFVANHPDTGHELWRSDGTAGGTEIVSDLNPGPGSTDWRQLTRFGDQVVFRAAGSVFSNEPWFSDGTALGTFALETVAGPEGSKPDAFYPIGDRLFFSILPDQPADPVDGFWVTDGSLAGTEHVTLPSVADFGGFGFFGLGGSDQVIFSGFRSPQATSLGSTPATAPIPLRWRICFPVRSPR